MKKDINDLTKNTDLKYERWYNNLITKAKNRTKRDSNEYYEIHHIIPKCIGGNNEKSNLVILTYREHIIAHMLLSNIYPNNIKLLFAVKAVVIHNKTSLRPNASKYISTRTLDRIKKDAINARKGIKMPDWFGKRISQSNKERIVSEETKKKISESNKGKPRTQSQLDIIKKYSFKKGQKPWNIGKKMSEDTKRKLSETRKKIMNDDLRRKYSEAAKKRGFRGKTKKVQGPDGTIYISTEECARQNKVSSGTIRNWIKNHPEKNFKFVD